MKHGEASAQRLFIKRVRMDPRTKDLPLCAIPNGERRDKITASLLKASGVLSGMPDLLLPVMRNGCGALWIEMKSPTGRLSKNQTKVIQVLRDSGYEVAICYSADSAWDALVKYMGLR